MRNIKPVLVLYIIGNFSKWRINQDATKRSSKSVKSPTLQGFYQKIFPSSQRLVSISSTGLCSTLIIKYLSKNKQKSSSWQNYFFMVKITEFLKIKYFNMSGNSGMHVFTKKSHPQSSKRRMGGEKLCKQFPKYTPLYQVPYISLGF